MSSRPQRRHIRTDILAKWRSSQSRRNVRHAAIAVGEVTDGERIVHRGSAHDTNPLSAAACINRCTKRNSSGERADAQSVR